LEPGDPQQIGGYQIVARLGAGGMGRVYLGRSVGGRPVAVKVVRAELAEQPGFRQRFGREVAAARRVGGTFTAGVVDADPEGDPAWLATAYVPGIGLDEAIEAYDPWPPRSVRALGLGITEALEAIHAAGVVHRDLKPSNVLLGADGPRVIDFGVSVVAADTSPDDIGFFPFPTVDGGAGAATEALGYCEGFAVGIHAPQEAVDFALFLAERAQQNALLAAGNQLPVLRDSVDQVPEGPVRESAEAITQATGFQLHWDWLTDTALTHAVGEATVRLLTGDTTPSQAAADIGEAAAEAA
jgi:serine/threonine protein kinase